MDTFRASGWLKEFPPGKAYRILLVSVTGGEVAAATPVDKNCYFDLQFEITDELSEWLKRRSPFVFVVRGDDYISVARVDGWETMLNPLDDRELTGRTLFPDEKCEVPGGEEGLNLAELIAQVDGIRKDMGRAGSEAVTQVVASIGDVLGSRGYLSLGDSGSEVARLHKMLEARGASGYDCDVGPMYFGQMTKEAVEKFQRDRKLPVTGAVDRVTWAELEIDSETRTVFGRAVYQNGLPAKKDTELKIRLRSETSTNTTLTENNPKVTTTAGGGFRLVLTGSPLEAQVLLASNNLALSIPVALKEKHTRIDVTIPQEHAASSEYSHVYLSLQNGETFDTLKITPAIPENAALLAQKYELDPRLVGYALAAVPLMTDEFCMHPATAYAIARCGFPMGMGELVHIATGGYDDAVDAYKSGKAPKTIADAIFWASEMQIFSAQEFKLDKESLTKELGKFEAAVREKRLGKVMPGSVSSFNQLLAKMGTNSDDANKLKIFLFADPSESGVDGAGLSTLGLYKYKFYSHLAAITRDNADLIAEVFKAMCNETPTDAQYGALVADGKLAARLVDAGLDEPELWDKLMDNLQSPVIPDVFLAGGVTVANARLAYTRDMAQRVFADATTSTLGKRTQAGQIRLPPTEGAVDMAELTKKVLSNVISMGFKFGEQSHIDRKDPNVFKGTNPAATEKDKSAAVDTVEAMDRLYAVAPSTSALSRLMELGFNSAQEIADMEERAFVARYVGTTPTTILSNEAKLIHMRSRQVADLTHKQVLDFLVGNATPSFPAMKALATTRGLSTKLMTGYPDLKQLFGTIDFAEVPEHRSVLGPAAYFVDLLRFIDLSAGQRGANGNPYTELTSIDRRPDLPKLKLSHENAFTMLPHIDIVNEILEQIILDNSVRPNGIVSHDTEPGTDVETEPRNTEFGAYDVLDKVVYPFDLPFSHGRAVRTAVLDHYGISPAFAMDTLQVRDKLREFDVCLTAERLGMSVEEVEMLTTAYTDWRRYFGYPAVQSPVPSFAIKRDQVDELTIGSAQVMANRLGVTYVELARIAKTWFVKLQLEDDPAATATVDFSKTWLVRSPGVPLNELDAMKMNFFTRIWRRLGCSIEQLDQALDTIFPKVMSHVTNVTSPTELANFLAKALVVLGGMVDAARRLEIDWKENLHELLTLFYRLPVGKEQILYRRLFLQPAVKKLGPVAAESGSGLTREMVKLALRLSDSDLKPSDDPSTPTSLGNLVSEVFQARFAGLSLQDWREAREHLESDATTLDLSGTFAADTTWKRVAQSLDLVEQGQRLLRSGWGVADLSTLSAPVLLNADALKKAIALATPPDDCAVPEPHLDGCETDAECKCSTTDRIAVRMIIESATKQRTVPSELLTDLCGRLFTKARLETADWKQYTYEQLHRWLWLAERAGMTLSGFKNLDFDLSPRPLIAYLATRNRLGLSDSAMATKFEALRVSPISANACAKVELDQAGVPLDILEGWFAEPTASTILDGFRRLQTEKSWPAVGKAVMDPLRKQRRDALLSCVLLKRYMAAFDLASDKGKVQIETPEELYNQLLIDPKAEPAVLTSRLVLATASVQQFIQRCLMNLEQNVRPTAIAQEQWRWMKRYRVWEAARKIMLYPENWLDPSIRDDKTPVFKKFESEVLGEESDDAAADRAFTGYVRDLEQIARLEIVATYLEEKPSDDAENEALHVLGRTAAMPHKYFYRKFVDDAWTPWEQVQTEPQGDHVTLAVWKGRLHLLWATFLFEDLANERISKGKTFTELATDKQIHTATPVRRDVSVQINWSEYSDGQWSAAQSTKMELIREKVLWNIDLEPISISVETSEEALTVVLAGLLQCRLTLNGGKDIKIEKRDMSYFDYDRMEDNCFSTNVSAADYATTSVENKYASEDWADPGRYSGDAHYGGLVSTVGLQTTNEKRLLTRAGEKAIVLTPSNRHACSGANVPSPMAPVFYSDESGVFFVQLRREQATSDYNAGQSSASALVAAETDKKDDDKGAPKGKLI